MMQPRSQESIDLGDTFKKQRESLSLSLKEIENAISVRHHYLAAIEEGNFGKLISPVYAQGFIKKYATFLGLDGEVLIQNYPQVKNWLMSKVDEEDPFAFGLGTLEVRGKQMGQDKSKSALLWGGLSLLIIVILWFSARYLGLF